MKMKTNLPGKRSYKGLTLLEILIVIAIMALLSVLSIMSFGPVKERAGLQSSTDIVYSTLNLAREYALQGKIPSGVTPGDPVCGYGFGFVDEYNYALFYYYPNDGDLSSCSNFAKVDIGIVSQEKLPSGAVLDGSSDTINNHYAIYFSIPFAKLQFYNPAKSQFKIRYDGISKIISVDSSGLIQ